MTDTMFGSQLHHSTCSIRAISNALIVKNIISSKIQGDKLVQTLQQYAVKNRLCNIVFHGKEKETHPDDFDGINQKQLIKLLEAFNIGAEIVDYTKSEYLPGDILFVASNVTEFNIVQKTEWSKVRKEWRKAKRGKITAYSHSVTVFKTRDERGEIDLIEADELLYDYGKEGLSASIFKDYVPKARIYTVTRNELVAVHYSHRHTGEKTYKAGIRLLV